VYVSSPNSSVLIKINHPSCCEINLCFTLRYHPQTEEEGLLSACKLDLFTCTIFEINLKWSTMKPMSICYAHMLDIFKGGKHAVSSATIKNIHVVGGPALL